MVLEGFAVVRTQKRSSSISYEEKVRCSLHRHPLHSSYVGDSRRSTCARCAPGYALHHESAFIGPTHAAFFLACLFFVPK
jgi:hypothetical protein